MTDRDRTGKPHLGSAPDRLVFFDTTLRDGEQSPGCSMSTPEKIEMAHALDELGIDILEAGFAISSEGDFEAIRAISRAVCIDGLRVVFLGTHLARVPRGRSYTH